MRKKKFISTTRGTSERPRLSIFRSNRSISVQLIDDVKRETMVASRVSGKTIEEGKKLGAQIAQRAAEKHIKTVIFDRSGYRYHGVVKAIADAAREGGLQF